MLPTSASIPRRLSTLALLLAMFSASAGAAAADASPQQIREAAEAFDRGREAYKSQDWVTAAEQFEHADSRAGSAPALEFSIRARDKAGQLDRAATLAVLASKRYPDSASLAKVAADVLERAESSLYELSVGCSERCDLAIDGKIVPGNADVQRTLYLPEGKHSIRAGFAGDRSDSQDVQATSGARGQITFDAPTEAAALPPEDEDISEKPSKSSKDKAQPAKISSGWSPTVFWIGTGLTGIVGGATIWSGIDTLVNPGKERIKNECAAGDTSCPTYQDGLARERRTNWLIGATAGVGIATIVVGAFLTDWSGNDATAPELDSPPPSDKEPQDEYTVNRRTRSPRQRVQITPWAAVGNGAMIGAQGRF